MGFFPLCWRVNNSNSVRIRFTKLCTFSMKFTASSVLMMSQLNGTIREVSLETAAWFAPQCTVHDVMSSFSQQNLPELGFEPRFSRLWPNPTPAKLTIPWGKLVILTQSVTLHAYLCRKTWIWESWESLIRMLWRVLVRWFPSIQICHRLSICTSNKRTSHHHPVPVSTPEPFILRSAQKVIGTSFYEGM